jgi:hypothetical protein
MEQNRAKAQERAFLHVLKALCTALDSAYATMGEEIVVPTPAMLAAGQDGLGWLCFVSYRLAAPPGLDAPLARLAEHCKTRDWGTGTNCEWGPLRRERAREALRAADKTVSVALGRALTGR